MIVSMLLTFLAFLLGTTLGAPCKVEQTTINCKNSHLTDVPAFDILSNRTAVYLNYNSITKVPENAFTNLSDTYELQLHLDYNNINEIDDNAFAGLENVSVRLYLDQNNFTKGLPEAMTSLNQLTHLSIDGIAVLSATVLANISSSLEHLSIGLDEHSQWPAELKALVHLGTLEVSGLKFGTIPTDAFHEFQSSLEFLKITSSSFNSSLSAICPLINLQALTLISDDVDDMVSFLPKCPESLNSTWMLTIQSVAFSAFPNVFETFPRLTSLEVTHNDQLEFIPEDSIAENNTVTHLKLNNNKLKQIPYIVQKMTHLEMLDLSSNSISIIEANDLGKLPKLVRLILSSNPIEVISMHAFQLLPTLGSLGLSNTGMSDVPKALLHAGNLKMVDLRHNPILCTCSLNWIMTTSLMTSIRGTCTDTTNITDFLTHNCTPLTP